MKTAALPVRMAAMQAAVSLTVALESPAQRKEMQARAARGRARASLTARQDLVPPMLAILAELLNKGDESTAQEALELLIELTGLESRFLRKHAPELAQAMLTIAGAAALEECSRQLAMEFLVSLAEAQGSPVRKLPELARGIFATALSFLLDIEEDAAWNGAEEESDFDAGQGDMFAVGMESLDRLSCALGGKLVMPLVAQQLPAYLAAGDWKARHAGLCALSQLAEGCAQVLRPDSANVAGMIVGLFRDPHPRVRWAAINAVGQLCTDLAPAMQAVAHATIAPALVSVLSQGEHLRVQAHAAAAIVNFAEECDAEVLAGYMDSVVFALLQLLRSPARLVQEGALTALASVADAAASQFEKYYDSVMPFLVSILQSAGEKTQRLLRAKALECATLVGLAVGRARFAEQAGVIVAIMVAMERAHAEAGAEADGDDPTPGYLLQAWARLAKCMGAAFLPYLPLVMPRLLATAGTKPDVVVQESGAELEDDDEGLEHIQMGDKVLSIRTSVLEDKAMALNMLCCYVEELKEGMLPYLEQIGQITLPLLKFYLNEEVRTSAVGIAPMLVKAAQAALAAGARDAAWAAALLAAVWAPLLEALEQEPDAEVTVAMLVAASETVEAAGGAALGAPACAALVAELCKQMSESEGRRREQAETAAAEEMDEEEREAAEELEEQLVDGVHLCCGALLKALRRDALPLLQPLMPQVVGLLRSPSPALRKYAIFVFDDVLEQCGGGDSQPLLPYFDAFFPAALAGCADGDAELRQAAAFGVGLASQRCADLFSDAGRRYARDAVAALCAGLHAADARRPAMGSATDNVVASLGRVLEGHRATLMAGEGAAAAAASLAQLWLSFFPLRHDLEEAREAHAQLLRLYEAGDTLVVGEGGSRAPAMRALFAACLEKPGMVNAETASRIRLVLQ